MAERLNFGCGPVTPAGWVNFDRDNHGQPYRGDISDGLPFADDTFECVAAHHVLQMLSWPELIPALTELHRVTTPGGWLRVSVPDILSAVYAYEVGDADHFQIADAHEKTIDGKLCLYLSQAGSTRSVFTIGWLEELCLRAGWITPRQVGFCVTTSPTPEIVNLDSRPAESIFLEAVA